VALSLLDRGSTVDHPKTTVFVSEKTKPPGQYETGLRSTQKYVDSDDTQKLLLTSSAAILSDGNKDKDIPDAHPAFEVCDELYGQFDD
jgi:hypothetical protein